MEICNAAVIGAGTMGNGIAHVMALSKFNVCLVDVRRDAVEKGMGYIRHNMDRQVAKGIISDGQRSEALNRITQSTSLETGVREADFIIEAATENVKVKKDLFHTLSDISKQTTVLASNTSSISITDLAAATPRPDKVIGMHFFNPVPVMKLIEVVRGLATSNDTYEIVRNLSYKLDKVPVEVHDYPGFVSNRILMPMINEAIFCIMENVASAESVDTVMKLGMNHPMGPLALADLIGLDVCLDIMNVIFHGTGDSKYRPCPLLKKMVAAGYLGRKSGRGFYTYEQRLA
ncbi:MAG: 3-hydroxybutyryl-CoA dehydrogenase [Candidatus Kryptoniota bacterium]